MQYLAYQRKKNEQLFLRLLNTVDLPMGFVLFQSDDETHTECIITCSRNLYSLDALIFIILGCRWFHEILMCKSVQKCDVIKTLTQQSFFGWGVSYDLVQLMNFHWFLKNIKLSIGLTHSKGKYQNKMWSHSCLNLRFFRYAFINNSFNSGIALRVLSRW